jgi:hypothetical protein
MLSGMLIYKNKNNLMEQFSISSFSYDANDVFGCGLVFPPSKMTEIKPYVFFTKNGKKIG